MKLKVTGLSGIQFGTRAIINKAGSLKLLLSGFLLLQTSQH